jgi:hypothetical protein
MLLRFSFISKLEIKKILDDLSMVQNHIKNKEPEIITVSVSVLLQSIIQVLKKNDFEVKYLENLLSKNNKRWFRKLTKNYDYQQDIDEYTDLIYELETLMIELQEYKKTKLVSQFLEDSLIRSRRNLTKCYFQNREWQFLLIEAQIKEYLYYEFLLAKKNQMEDEKIWDIDENGEKD